MNNITNSEEITLSSGEKGVEPILEFIYTGKLQINYKHLIPCLQASTQLGFNYVSESFPSYLQAF